jgi:hypothetical protein
VIALGLCMAAAGSPSSPANEGPGKEVLFDARSGLGAGWRDLGWAPHELPPGKPAEIDFADRGGWILSRKGLTGNFRALTVRYRAAREFGDFLEARLDSSRAGFFPRVPITADLRREGQDGWTEAVVPISSLDPRGQPFDQVVLRARVELGHQRVAIESIALVLAGAGEPMPAPAPTSSAPTVTPTPAPMPGGGRPVRFVADCRAAGRAINPLIYSLAGKGSNGYQWTMGAAAIRWGGNPTTRFNWQLGNAWNTGSDWFFRNVSAPSFDKDLDDNLSHGRQTALTVPTIGWVAKDATSYSFPVSAFGPQETIAPENPDIGNGKYKGGVAILPGPQTRTSIPAPPEFIGRWLASIRAKDQKRGQSLKMVILDNEPGAWHNTHRDVHPAPLTYDELLQRTIDYGTAVRKAYPEALIAGPAEWGWTAYFYSAKDNVAGIAKAPDRRAHGNVPLLPWWLAKVRAHERKTGLKILDVLDVHYYPQGNNIGVDRDGGTDRSTNALRLRSTRSLWDPSYFDESWINERIELIPRLRRWVATNAPGVGIALGEYSFGAGEHQSGGLAEAEALGRFGTEGLTAAFFWRLPSENSPVYWAFRAFRNFDGKGGRFLDLSVPVKTEGPGASLFLSRSPTKDHLVGVLLNLDADEALSAEIDLSSCGPHFSERSLVYTGGPIGFVPAPPSQAHAAVLRRNAAPYSMTVLDLTAAP